MSVNARHVMSSFGWVAAVNYSNRLFGFLTTLVLAKFLAPQDFGLIAIASMMIEVLSLMKDVGLSEALIYNKREDQAAIDTANTLLVGLNTALFVLAAATAPLVARFYQNPAILPLIIVMSSNLVWDSLRAVPRALVRKNMQFDRLVIPELVPVVVSSAVGILMAVMGFGVWSLAVRTLLYSVIGMVLLRNILPVKPRLRFDRPAARELLHYGKFIVGTTVLLVVVYNIDRFYVSSVAGIAALGIFELAMRLADMPVKEFSFVVGSVMFPLFSKLDRSGQALRDLFLKTLKYTGAVSVPMAVGMSVFGPPLIARVYGARWEPMVGPLRVLALYAVFRSLSSIIYDAFKATGRPELMQRFVIFRLVSIATLGIPALTFFGLMGICFLILATYACVFLWEMRTLTRLFHIRLSAGLLLLVRPLALALAIIPGGYLALVWLFQDVAALELLAVAVILGAAYVATFLCLDRETLRDVKSVVTRSGAVPASAS